MNEIAAHVAGEDILLSSGKALFWPRLARLFVADVHFGKAAAFRARGVPVPHGTTQDNLERLDQLIERYAPQTLVFLGDFSHAREAREVLCGPTVAAWRAKHQRTSMLLVRGNHDAHAGDPPADLGIESAIAPRTEGPFEYCHAARERRVGYGLTGHIHPAWVVHGRADESVRLPCFWLTPTFAVLPAFGAFTGSMVVERSSGDRIFVVAGNRLFET
jgi:DNA ligase-associated metallophosphoesterase